MAPALEVLEGVPEAGAELDEVRATRAAAQECLSDGGRLLRRFTGHTGWVSSVCAGRNGRSALSGGADGTLKLWSTASGRCLRTLEGHAEWVTSVSLSSDGRIALSGSPTATLRLWRTDDGKCLRVLEGHGNWVLAAALSGDGQLALSGSGDGTIKLWETATGACLCTLDGHEGPVLACAGAPMAGTSCPPAAIACFCSGMPRPGIDCGAFWPYRQSAGRGAQPRWSLRPVGQQRSHSPYLGHRLRPLSARL